eukprot:5015551-Alexandrium_andersonii.AAC.1
MSVGAGSRRRSSRATRLRIGRALSAPYQSQQPTLCPVGHTWALPRQRGEWAGLSRRAGKTRRSAACRRR